MAIAATAAVTSTEALSPAGFLDETSPQVIEKINGNMVTYRNGAGESRKSYLPTWMFSKFNLQVGSSVNLFDDNMAQVSSADPLIKSTPPKLNKVDASAPRSNCILVPLLDLAICRNQPIE